MKKENNNDLKQKAYLFIKNKIITGEFKPGDDIIEKDIQEAMGISRTPVREALIRLENDNLVHIYPRKGIFVSNITPKLIKDLFQIRMIVEPQVLKIVGPLIDKDWLYEIKIKFTTKPLNLNKEELDNYYIELDKEFHSHLNNLCNNDYLISLMDNIFDQNERFRHQTYSILERDKKTTKEHLEIIFHLINDDYEKAVESLITHIKNSEEVAFKYIMI